MTNKGKPLTAFKPGRGYAAQDWDAVSDNAEWTPEDFKNARPFAEVFPEMAASLTKRRGRPNVESPKKQVTLRLDADLIERIKADGRGWQSRVNAALRKVFVA